MIDKDTYDYLKEFYSDESQFNAGYHLAVIDFYCEPHKPDEYFGNQSSAFRDGYERGWNAMKEMEENAQ